MTEYIVTDRTTATKYAISIADGELLYTETESDASSEPIVQDNTNSSDYWKIFIDDGQLGYESTATEQDDSLIFTDTVTGGFVELAVDDGEMVMTPQVSGAVVRVTKYHIVRYLNTPKINRFDNSLKVCI